MNTDDDARRAYWTEQMEAGYALVQKLISFPVSECGECFCSLRDAAAVANVEMQTYLQLFVCPRGILDIAHNLEYSACPWRR